MNWQWVNDNWFEADAIEKRLKERISLIEFGVIVFLISWLLGLVILYNQGLNELWGDLNKYLACAKGQCEDFYYGYWILPIFSLLGKLPYQITYIIWGSINIAGIWFATRVFGGNKFIALISYPMLSVLWYGQISGLILASIAFGFYGIVKRNWILAGIGLGIALVKYNIAMILIIPMILGTKLTIKELALIFIWPVGFIGLSLITYPGWFIQVVNRIWYYHPMNSYSLSIWPYIGIIALILFIPLFLLPNRIRFLFIGWIIAGTIGSPYFQLKDILILLIMPIPTGIAFFISYFGFAHFFISTKVIQIYIIFQIVLYIYFLWQTLVFYKKVESINFFNRKVS
jgi:hypothetical protein